MCGWSRWRTRNFRPNENAERVAARSELLGERVEAQRVREQFVGDPLVVENASRRQRFAMLRPSGIY
jgi:hypothetical protein